MIASGARYRRLDVANLDEFEATSVHYWASPLEGKLCAGQEVALVGAGNSAGQATVYLASQAAKVWLIVRGRDLTASMSRYLVDRINGLANVEVVTQAQISGLEGSDGMLEAVRWRRAARARRRGGRSATCSCSSAPTRTPTGCRIGVKLDAKGFVLTGEGSCRRAASAGDQPARRLRHRRRALGLGQARGRRRWRRRAGGRRAARLSRRGRIAHRWALNKAFSSPSNFPIPAPEQSDGRVVSVASGGVPMPNRSHRPLTLARALLVVALPIGLSGCDESKLPENASAGPDPNLPAPSKSIIPTVNIATAKGWPQGTTPKPASGLLVRALADHLEHPRWLYVLPNGDVLVAETNAPPKPEDGKGIKGWFMKTGAEAAGAGVPSANRITLLRDADGDGVAETRTVFSRD